MNPCGQVSIGLGQSFLFIYLLQNREESSMLESAPPETKEINELVI